MQDDPGSIPKTNGIVQYFSVISEASHWSDKAGLNHQSNMANMGISSTPFASPILPMSEGYSMLQPNS